jgi:predicted  nucleic acid-binding Zn-ribbon protein
VNKHLEQLVKLSNFDKEIIGFEPKIQQENDKLKIFLKTVDNLNTKIANLNSDLDESQKKIEKNNFNLEDLTNKLAETITKYDSVKTEKESRALQLEEEILKEQTSFCNDEIVRLDNIISLKKEELSNIKDELKQEEIDITDIKDVVNSSIEVLNKQRESVSKSRVTLINKIDKKILSFYERIRRWANETAVVEVKNQACYGCHMKLTNKVYSEFLIIDEITNCPHCGRIIYKSNES